MRLFLRMMACERLRCGATAPTTTTAATAVALWALLWTIAAAAPLYAQDGGGFEGGFGVEGGASFESGFGAESGGGFEGGFGGGTEPGSGAGSGFEGGFHAEFEGGFGSSFEGGFEGGFGTAVADAAGTGLRWSGRLRFDSRLTANYDHPAESPLDSRAAAQLELNYGARASELIVRGELLQNAESTSAQLDEAYLSLFADRVTAHAGWLKAVWGKGDQLHVVDLLNANDFTDFVNPDYIERRLAAPMLKLDAPLAGGMGLLELAYLPLLRTDRIPTGGAWAPAQAATLESAVEAFAAGYAAAYAQQLIAADPTLSPTVAAALGQSAAADLAQNVLREPDTSTLEHAQIGARLTGSVGRFDLGAVYYWGFQKTPSVRMRLTDPADPRIELFYPRLHALGIEAGAAFGRFNTKAELAYYATEDWDGTDVEIPNHSLNYVAGFDMNLPLSNLNLNVQGYGSVILNSNEIDAAGPLTPSTPGGDAQFDPDGIYTSHIVSLALTDSYRNDRIKPELAFSVGLERQDWRIAPQVQFALRDDAKLGVRGVVFGGEEQSLFGQYDRNDFIEVRFEYTF